VLVLKILLQLAQLLHAPPSTLKISAGAGAGEEYERNFLEAKQR
jgi:hypothetical protein